MMGTQVDDICSAGNDTFKELLKRVDYTFDCKDRVENGFHFAGVHVKPNDDNTIDVDQLAHVNCLELLRYQTIVHLMNLDVEDTH